ncbi:MAG: hypothetical protein K2N87_03245 [Eubacterium sp.]|nr:hypothetical protein [Eubacterium sp.]
MEIKVALKSIGKKKQTVQAVPCQIQGRPSTVKELILAVTEAEVLAYNSRAEEPKLLRHMILEKEDIEDQAQAGRISFGTNYGGKQADLQEAQEHAVQSFLDGIYRIFLDDMPLEALDDKICITEHSVFTFVRLTMLAGRMW